MQRCGRWPADRHRHVYRYRGRKRQQPRRSRPPTYASGIRVFVPPEENKGRPVLSQPAKSKELRFRALLASRGTSPPTWASAEARLSRSILFLVCRDEVYTKSSPTTGDSRPVLQGLAYHGRSLRCRGQTFRAVCTLSCRVRRGSATKAFMGSSCPYPTFLYGSWWAYSAMAPRSTSFSSAMYRSIACLNLGWRISCAL